VPGTTVRLSKVVVTAGGLRVATNGHVVLMFESDLPLAFPEGQPLVVHLSAAIRLTGFVEYTQVPSV
jgi:hypothetical protein